MTRCPNCQTTLREGVCPLCDFTETAPAPKPSPTAPSGVPAPPVTRMPPPPLLPPGSSYPAGPPPYGAPFPTGPTMPVTQRPSKTPAALAVLGAAVVIALLFAFQGRLPTQATPSVVPSSSTTPQDGSSEPSSTQDADTQTPGTTTQASVPATSGTTTSGTTTTEAATSKTTTSGPTTSDTSEESDLEREALSWLQAQAESDGVRVSKNGQFTAQLSSKWVGTTDPLLRTRSSTHTFYAEDIWYEYQQLKSSVSDADVVLLDSRTYGKRVSHNGEPLWVVMALNSNFTSVDGVKAWCKRLYPNLSGDALNNSCMPNRLNP